MKLLQITTICLMILFYVTQRYVYIYTERKKQISNIFFKAFIEKIFSIVFYLVSFCCCFDWANFFYCVLSSFFLLLQLWFKSSLKLYWCCHWPAMYTKVMFTNAMLCLNQHIVITWLLSVAIFKWFLCANMAFKFYNIGNQYFLP